MAGGGAVGGEQVEHPLAVLDAAAGREADAEDGLGGGVVLVGAEEEIPLLMEAEAAGPLGAGEAYLGRGAHLGLPGQDPPAGEGAGDLDDVLLAVAAVDAQGVELHQLAGVVLVDPLLPLLLRREGRAREPVLARREHPLAVVARHGRIGIVGYGRATAAEAGAPAGRAVLLVLHRRRLARRRRRLGVIEVDQHRRALGGGLEEAAEAAEGLRADGVALVGEEIGADLGVGRRDVEVVEPEIGHHLFELVLGLDGAHQLLGHQLADQLLLRTVPLLGGEGLQLGLELVPLRVVLPVLDLEVPPLDVVGEDPSQLRLDEDGARRRIGLEDLVGGHIEGRQLAQVLQGLGVGEVRRELAVEPAVEPHPDDGVHLAGPGAEGEAVQQVSRRLPLGQPRLLPGHMDGDRLRRLAMGHAGPRRAEGDGGGGQKGGKSWLHGGLLWRVASSLLFN
jgi:hypothetical protein